MMGSTHCTTFDNRFIGSLSRAVDDLNKLSSAIVLDGYDLGRVGFDDI